MFPKPEGLSQMIQYPDITPLPPKGIHGQNKPSWFAFAPQDMGLVFLTKRVLKDLSAAVSRSPAAAGPSWGLINAGGRAPGI